jgi:hypothetical protein
MALVVTSPLTEIDDCDTDNWTGDPSVGLDTDFQREGTGCIGMDVDIETITAISPSFTAANYTGRILYFWLFSFTASTLDIKSAGGMQIGVQDGSGNQSFWYVGGADNYAGGWEVLSANLATTPDRNNGTNATLTNITNVCVAFKNTAKSKLSQNCFVDWCRYGTLGAPALVISGTNTTIGDGWSEVLSDDEAGAYGIIKGQKGSYILKGPVDIGDAAGFAATDFTDYIGSSLVFDDQPVGDSHYNITVNGNATGTTDCQLGSVVGTGDARQGVLGTSVSTLGPLWEWDSATDIADVDGVELYGCSFTGAGQGVGLDDNTKTKVISSTFTNCGAVDPGSTNNGAEILNCFIIDPDGVLNNYGYSFPQTPSGGTLTHNGKNINFITSGTPSTQYMLFFNNASDYSVSLLGFKFFGSYTSGTLWHGRNIGASADVTINASGGSDPVQAEFQSTAGGTVTVNNTVTLSVQVNDAVAGGGIEDALVSIRNATTNALISEGRCNTSGLYTDSSYNYGGDVSVNVYVRRSSPGYKRYIDNVGSGTIQSTGLSVTLNMRPDPNVMLTPVSDFRIARMAVVSNDVSGATISAQVSVPQSSTGNRKIVVMGGFRGGASQTVSGTPTFNGQNMTLFQTLIDAPDNRVWGYYYDVPNNLAADTYTMSFTFSSAVPERTLQYAIYNKAATGAPDASDSEEGSAVTANPSLGMTPTTTNNIESMFVFTDDTSTAPTAGGTANDLRVYRYDEFMSGNWQGATLLNNQDTAAFHSLSCTFSASSKDYVAIAASIAEA